MTKSKTKQSYESALQELQQIVADLQEAAISMDALSEKVSRAGELLKYCKEKLRETEERAQGILDL